MHSIGAERQWVDVEADESVRRDLHGVLSVLGEGLSSARINPCSRTGGPHIVHQAGMHKCANNSSW